MHNDPRNILPESRVMAFDSSLYIDDVKTPLSVTVKTGTVVCRYGYISEYIEREHGRELAKYPDLVDICFDHRPDRISHGHFTSGIKEI